MSALPWPVLELAYTCIDWKRGELWLAGELGEFENSEYGEKADMIFPGDGTRGLGFSKAIVGARLLGEKGADVVQRVL